uniref:Putative membrane protein yttA n=1 Tax=Lygus hesperus TaxID=30085 RepID=A0A0A9XT02_LYGHE
MMKQCRCGKEIESDKNFAQCSVEKDCQSHFACVGIRESTWLGQGSGRRKNWICPFHRNIVKRQDVTSTSIRRDNPSVSSELISTKEHRELSQRDMEELKKFLGERLDRLESTIDGLRAELKSQREEIAQVKKDNSELKSENSILKKELATVKLQLNTFESYTRRKNLIIRGIKKNEDEDLKEVVLQLSGKLGLEASRADLTDIFRLPTKKVTAASPIVVKLATQNIRDKFISASKKKRLSEADLVGGGDRQIGIYCEEHIGPGTKQVFNHCLDSKRKGLLSQLWIAAGRVCVRLVPGGESFRIDSVESLEKIIQKK